jgi:hypothetical protein
MILSSHNLAVEHRRWKECGKKMVPREWRLCRFCETNVEDPAHAMVVCQQPDLSNLREVFLAKLYAEVPEFEGKFTSPMAFFWGVLERRAVTPLLAKLAFDVLRVYESTPMLVIEPRESTSPGVSADQWWLHVLHSENISLLLPS